MLGQPHWCDSARVVKTDDARGLICFHQLKRYVLRLYINGITAERQISHQFGVRTFNDRISELIRTLPRTMIATRTVRLQSSVGKLVFCCA